MRGTDMDVIFPRFPAYTEKAPAVACPYFQCWHCLSCGFYKGDRCSLCLDFSGLCKDCLFCDSADCRSDYYAMHDKSDYFELAVVSVTVDARFTEHYFLPLQHAIYNCFEGFDRDLFPVLWYEIYDDSGILLVKVFRSGKRSYYSLYVNVV